MAENSIKINSGGSQEGAPLEGAPEPKPSVDGKPPVESVEPASQAAAPKTPLEGADKAPLVPRIEAPKVAAKLDLSKAVQEFGKDGKVSEATYKEAEKRGLDRADVDTYIAGHKARVDGVVTALSQAVGGEAQLRSIMEWAGSNTDAETRDAFNAAVDSGNSKAASLMLRGLASEYEAAVGSEGQRITGEPSKGGLVPFANWEQVRVAMSDRRYGKDAQYNAQVAARMKISKI